MVISFSRVRVAQERRYWVAQIRVDFMAVDIDWLDQTIGFAWGHVGLLSLVVVQNYIENTRSDCIGFRLEFQWLAKCLSWTEDFLVWESFWGNERGAKCHIVCPFKSNRDNLHELGLTWALGSTNENALISSHQLNNSNTIVGLLHIYFNLELIGNTNDCVV